MYIKGFRVTDVVGAPHPVDELATREHPPAVAHQVLEQVELLERQRDRLAVDGDDVTLDIHAHRTRLQHPVTDAGVVVVAAAPQYRADARDQLTRRVGFGDIVVGPEFEPDHLVDLAVTRRHHDDGNA